MATRTSTTSGNWATGGTWVGGVAPVDGDSAIIATGHTVTVAANATIGNNPASNNFVVTCQGTGGVTVAAGVTFTVKGGITMENGALQGGAGAVISISPTASNQTYTITLGTYASSSSLVMAGTAGARCKIQKANAYGMVYITGSVWDGSPTIDCDYTDFPGLGSASDDSIKCYGPTYLDYCTFIASGRLAILNANYNFDIHGCHFDDGLEANTAYVESNYVAGAHTKRFRQCSFSGTSILGGYNPNSVTVEGCFFQTPPNLYPDSPATAVEHFRNNFIVGYLNSPITVDGKLENNYHFNDGSTTVLVAAQNEFVIDGAIFDSTVTANSGAITGPYEPGSLMTFSVKNSLSLAGATTGGYSALVNDHYSANSHWTITNNTINVGEVEGIIIGGENVAGTYPLIQDNVVFADAGTSGTSFIHDSAGDAVNGTVTAADHNGCYNITTPYSVHAAGVFHTTPGTGDISSNPNFVGGTRCLARWSETILGHTGTDAQLCTSALLTLNDMNYGAGADYHAGVSVEDLLTWVKAGYAPQLAAYNTAGHAGGYIGAVIPVLPVTVTDVPMLLMAAL